MDADGSAVAGHGLMNGWECLLTGEMPEWPQGHDWKACVSQGTEGSNPSLSARFSFPRPSSRGSLPLHYSVANRGGSWLWATQS